MTRPDRGAAVAALCALVVFAVLVAAWGQCATWDEAAPPTATRCP